MSDQDRLEELYYSIGDTNGKVSDDVFAEVEHLENILNPSPLLKPLYAYSRVKNSNEKGKSGKKDEIFLDLSRKP